MRSGLRVGRLFGISIYVDWSWLVIFVLIASQLALGFFAAWHPDWGVALSWGIGILGALIFFASVLLHELAHSLVAKANGLPVRRIVLYFLGGVSNIEREPPSAGQEFIIALVGPLTSIVLGIVFTVLGRQQAGQLFGSLGNPAQALRQMAPMPTLLVWLGSANLLIGIFNLIPAFPLDGGRVLRSIIWAFTNNLRRSTRWASGISRAIAWLFIIGGIAMAFGARIPFFGTGTVSGIWLAFIGWFLNSAATQAYQQMVIEDLLEGVPVARLMLREPPAVAPDMSVDELVHGHIIGSDERSFPVLEEGQLVGLVSLEDVRRAPREEWDTKLVRDIMTPADQVATVSLREDASEAFQKFMQRDVRQMPVMEQGQMVGMLRRRDLMRYLQLQSGPAMDGHGAKPEDRGA